MTSRNRRNTTTLRGPRRPRVPRRVVRRLLRYRGMLRCEWCGRMAEVTGNPPWSTVSLLEWAAFAAEHPVWFCDRPRCVANRTEFDLPDRRAGIACSRTAP